MRALLILITLLLAGCRAAPVRPTPPLSIGLSHNNLPIHAHTLGRGPFRVYLVASIHGDEPEGLAALDPLLGRLAADPALRRATLRIIRDANPDGTAARTRGNARGRDLNRNWPASNFSARDRHGESPLSEPESAALHADLTRFNPHLVIVFHSARNGPFVNYDGPARDAADAFAAAAAAGDPRWRTEPSMGYPTPGSLGSYLGVDRATPILTVEFRRGQSPESALRAAAAGVPAAIRSAAPPSR